VGPARAPQRQAHDQMRQRLQRLIRFPLDIPTRSGFVNCTILRIDPEMSRMALAPQRYSPPRPNTQTCPSPIPSRWAWPGRCWRSRFAASRALHRRATAKSGVAVAAGTSWVTNRSMARDPRAALVALLPRSGSVPGGCQPAGALFGSRPAGVTVGPTHRLLQPPPFGCPTAAAGALLATCAP